MNNNTADILADTTEAFTSHTGIRGRFNCLFFHHLISSYLLGKAHSLVLAGVGIYNSSGGSL